MEEWITYSELVELAKSKGIRPTKVSVGIWADQQGYVKIRKQIDKKRNTYYYKSKKVCM